jgi:predicted GIY-YIG superfamily endonuclease
MARGRQKTSIVYKVTNIVNGNLYIGVTCTTLNERRRQHLNDARTQKGRMHFHAAIRKYGVDNFTWEVIAEFPDYDLALQAEIERIAELKPSYNATKGGQGVVGLERTPEWMAKISAKRKGQKSPQHVIDAVVKAKSRPITCTTDGKIFPSSAEAARFYGINKSAVVRVANGHGFMAKNLHFIKGAEPLSFKEWERLSREAGEKRDRTVFVKRTAEQWLIPKASKRKVYCITMDKTFESAAEAGRAYNINPTAILQCCMKRKHRITAGGMKFKYAEAA